MTQRRVENLDPGTGLRDYGRPPARPPGDRWFVFARIIYFGAFAGGRTIVITAEADDSGSGSAVLEDIL